MSDRKLIEWCDILQPRNIHAVTPSELDEVLSSSRQRLFFLAVRLWCYKRASARKKQNKSFRKKTVYGELHGAQLQNTEIKISQVEDMADYTD